MGLTSVCFAGMGEWVGGGEAANAAVTQPPPTVMAPTPTVPTPTAPTPTAPTPTAARFDAIDTVALGGAL